MVRRARDIFRLDFRAEGSRQSPDLGGDVRLAISFRAPVIITPTIMLSTAIHGLDLGCVDS